jgi:hypothetical protein
MGIGPHFPLPPAFMLLASWSAVTDPLYFSRMLDQDGPTTFLSA